VSTGRAGFGAGLGFAAGASESESELSVDPKELSDAADCLGAGVGLSALVAAAGPFALESSAPAGEVGELAVLGEFDVPAAGGVEGAVLPSGVGAGVLDAGSGVMLGELEDAGLEAAELEDEESLGAGFVVVAEGLFELEPNHGIGCPFQRRYPNPAASNKAIRIRRTLPALLPRGVSSSSSR